MSLLFRVLRILFVLNGAFFGLWLQKGWRTASLYLRGLYKLYLYPHSMGSGLTLVPPVNPEEVISDAASTGVEVLHPLPRPGGMRMDELMMLCLLVRDRQPQRLVEIGTADGRTTLNLALHAPDDAEILTFDLPPKAPSAISESGPDYRQLDIAEPGGLFRGHSLASKIHPIRQDSTTFDWSPYEGTVDFVFIDGAHDYASVRKDTENALRVVRPNGVILWHDYNNPVVDDVTVWLNELCQQLPLVWFAGTTLAFLQVRQVPK